MLYAIFVLAVVGLAVGVGCLAFACVVFGGVGGLTAFGGELVGDLFFFLLLGHCSYNYIIMVCYTIV